MQHIGMQEEDEEEFMTNDILKGKSNSLSRDAGEDQSCISEGDSRRSYSCTVTCPLPLNSQYIHY